MQIRRELSVQAHPSDECAREYEGDNGKTEMWYVIDVTPDVKQNPRLVKHYLGCSRELSCHCKYFETEQIQATI